MIELLQAEQAALRPPEQLSVADWCNANIILLPETSREPGRYRWQRTPYTRDLINLYQHPSIHHIVLKFATQTGKTQSLYNILAYLIDQDPFSTLLVYPTDDAAREISRTRIQPMIEAAESLKAKKPKEPRLYQLNEMTFAGMVLHIVGSNSAAPLAQKPVRNLFRDEVNKWPANIAGHGDPLDLSAERFKSFFDIRKIVDVSSPTGETGNITKLEAGCQVILNYFVPCPFCKRLQTLEWEQIKFDNERELEKVERIAIAKQTAHYECKFCRSAIGDEHKEWMLAPENGAGWFDLAIEEPEPTNDPIGLLFEQFAARGIVLESIAARLSSLYSPWIRWGDIVQKFLEAHLSEFKRYEKLRSFQTDWLGIEWKDIVNEKSETDILAHRCELEPLIVPAEAIALTCGIDCQLDGFYFVIRAWSKNMTSWLIRYGFLLNWQDVHELIFNDTYQIADCEDRAGLWRAAIDTGGGADGDRSMTAEAYEWISKFGGNNIYGVKGASREMLSKMKLTVINSLPNKRNIPMIGGGLRLWVIDTAYFKDLFHSRLQIKDGDAGAIYLHSETGADYARQIVSEEKRRDKNGVYRWEHVRGQNHYFDAEVYCSCLVDSACYGGLAVFSGKKQKPKKQKSSLFNDPRSAPSGFHNRKDYRPSWLDR